VRSGSVTWRPRAADQLADILGYIAERDKQAADRIDGLVSKSVALIRAAPDAGRPGRVPRTREWVVHPNYLIVYRVTRSGIVILRFLHARQLYP
jgi:addiction module RelE/StbE family toxin